MKLTQIQREIFNIEVALKDGKTQDKEQYQENRQFLNWATLACNVSGHTHTAKHAHAVSKKVFQAGF